LAKIGDSLSSVVVWDGQGSPPVGDWMIVLWRSFGDAATPQVSSIPKLVEANAEVLRSRFLAWIYELGETSISGRRLLDHLELRPGFSYWWMTLLSGKCNYGGSPEIDDAIRMMTFDDWAADRALGRVTLASANQPLAECMRLWCAKAGVVFTWQRLPKPAAQLSWMRRIYNSLPLALQAWAWLVRYVVIRWPLRGVGLKGWQQTEGKVTFLSYLFNLEPSAVTEGRYESRYWAHLPDTLQREGCKTNWLHLFVKDSVLPSAGKAASTIRDFNKTALGAQAHITLDAFLTVRVVLKTLRDWFKIAWACRQLPKQVSVTTSGGLALWPLLADDWRQSMVGPTAISNCLNLNLFESAMKSLPRQRIGVYLQENQGWECGVIQAWTASGHGQLVGCPHSTVRFWDLRYFFDPRSYKRQADHPMPLPNQVALNGAAAMQAYLAGGYPADELNEVEALRYLYLDEFSASPRTDSTTMKGVLRLLVFGDYLLSSTEVQMCLLKLAVPSLPAGTVITVKPHPACPIKPEDYPGVRMTVTMAPMVTLLSECDVAYTSEMTSAAVEAYCAGIPVISVRDPNTFNLSPLRGREGVSFASTPEELASALISAATTSCLTRKKQDFFTLDARLPRWKKLILETVE
jgi:surface carbohydrate biosynthesis protein (TIGR04326 family)